MDSSSGYSCYLLYTSMKKKMDSKANGIACYFLHIHT